MVLNFIKKIRYELKDEKIKIESERNKIQNELNRTRKFLQRLKEEEDQEFDIFSPRRKNIKIHDNIQTLEQEQKILSDTSLKLDEDLIRINSRLNEIDEILKITREQNTSKKNKNLDITEEKQNQHINTLIQKIDLSIHLLVVDPNRCKMELTAVKKSLEEMFLNEDKM